jgi:hypothetical protein
LLDSQSKYLQFARADAGDMYFIAEDGFGYFSMPQTSASTFIRSLVNPTSGAQALQIEPNSGVVSYYDSSSQSIISQVISGGSTTIPTISNVVAVSGDTTYVYWLTAPSSGNGTLYRAARADTSTIEVIASQVASPAGLATLNSCIYWLTGDGELHQFSTNYP